jgi:hypothetical protein
MRLATATVLAILVLGGLALRPSPAAAAVDSFFDIFTELPLQGPPYPMEEVSTGVGTMAGGTFVVTQEKKKKVKASGSTTNGLPPGDPDFDLLRVVGGGGGAGGSPPAIDSFFDIFVDWDYPSSAWNRRISDVHIVHPPGSPPGTWRLVPINPGAPVGSIDSFFDVFVSESFFDITYRVADDTGTHTYHTHGTSPSGRMSFFDVFVELHNPVPYPDGSVDSFFDVFVDANIQGPRNAQPDCREHTTGTYEGGATPTTSSTWGAIKRLYR